jgi:hypothetical protein
MKLNSPSQRFIVDLPVITARRSLAIVHDSGIYANFNELVTVALENQLLLDSSSGGDVTPSLPPHRLDVPEVAVTSEPIKAAARDTQTSGSLGRRPPSSRKAAVRKATRAKTRPSSRDLEGEAAAVAAGATGAFNDLTLEALLDIPSRPVAEPPRPIPGSSPLSAFTNRLTPLIIPARVLANAMNLSGPPSVEDFVPTTADIARKIGLWVRQEDERQGRRGRLRRWTAWPVGDDEKASLSRFRKSFLLGLDGDGASGPLLDLGLAVIKQRHVVPTERTFQVAADKTPLLGELEDGPLLSSGQQEALRSALGEIEGERGEIRGFFKAVREAKGAQGMVDQLIAAAHAGWTEAQVVSHRAAMVGRLRDAGLVDVSTPVPGKEVEIWLEPPATDFERALGLRRR